MLVQDDLAQSEPKMSFSTICKCWSLSRLPAAALQSCIAQFSHHANVHLQYGQWHSILLCIMHFRAHSLSLGDPRRDLISTCVLSADTCAFRHVFLHGLTSSFRYTMAVSRTTCQREWKCLQQVKSRRVSDALLRLVQWFKMLKMEHPSSTSHSDARRPRLPELRPCISQYFSPAATTHNTHDMAPARLSRLSTSPRDALLPHMCRPDSPRMLMLVPQPHHRAPRSNHLWRGISSNRRGVLTWV